MRNALNRFAPVLAVMGLTRTHRMLLLPLLKPTSAGCCCRYNACFSEFLVSKCFALFCKRYVIGVSPRVFLFCFVLFCIFFFFGNHWRLCQRIQELNFGIKSHKFVGKFWRSETELSAATLKTSTLTIPYAPNLFIFSPFQFVQRSRQSMLALRHSWRTIAGFSTTWECKCTFGELSSTGSGRWFNIYNDDTVQRCVDSTQTSVDPEQLLRCCGRSWWGFVAGSRRL